MALTGFDALAPHYSWMEAILAGRQLESCRRAFLERLPPIKRALLAGEGHGCFLAALLQKSPSARITYVDSSAAMMAVARDRLRRRGLSTDNVEFCCAKLPDWQPVRGAFDLIATNFFLDCFDGAELPRVIVRLAEGAAAGARWTVADFQTPSAGLPRLRATAIHFVMYAFFRRVTGISARRIIPPEPLLRQAGFRSVGRQEFEWGLLYAELWERATA